MAINPTQMHCNKFSDTALDSAFSFEHPDMAFGREKEEYDAESLLLLLAAQIRANECAHAR